MELLRRNIRRATSVVHPEGLSRNAATINRRRPGGAPTNGGMHLPAIANEAASNSRCRFRLISNRSRNIGDLKARRALCHEGPP